MDSSPEIKKLGFIVNPAAKGGKAGKRWKKITKKIDAIFPGQWSVLLTERSNHAPELVGKLIEQGCDVIVAVGGDGTINECVNGYLQANGKEKGVALAIFPLGTGGDFRKTIKQTSNKTSHHLKMYKKNRRIIIDVGHLKSTQDDGSEKEKYFINIASFGISSATVEKLTNAKKGLGEAAYLYHTVQTNMKYKCLPILYSLDGEEKKAINTYVFCICNGQYFGGGMKISPDAIPHDSLFHITSMYDVSFRQALFSLSHRIRNGTHIDASDNAESYQAKQVYAEPDPNGLTKDPILIEADGELSGRLPATFSIKPQSIELIVPESYWKTLLSKSKSTLFEQSENQKEDTQHASDDEDEIDEDEEDENETNENLVQSNSGEKSTGNENVNINGNGNENQNQNENLKENENLSENQNEDRNENESNQKEQNEE